MNNTPRMEESTAIIKIKPDEDEAVKALYQESQSILHFAESRVIATNEDLKPATDDLALIAKLKKALEEKRKEYVTPIREKLDAVNAAFKTLTAPLEEADRITRSKVLDFRQEQERKRQEVEAIEREKLQLARREAALKGGETTVDLTPIEKPEAPPIVTRTDMGSAGTVKIRKWEVEDMSKIPIEYLMIDATKVGKVVRAGIPSIPGIRIWEEETLRVNTR